MNRSVIDKLKTVAPFRDLSDVEFEKNLRYFQHIVYRKAKALFYQEDMAEQCLFIISGRVKKVKWRSDESTIFLGTSGSGEWLGLAETLMGTPYLFDSLCEIETEVLSIQRSSLRSLFCEKEFITSISSSLAREQFLLHRILTAPGPRELILHFLEKLPKKGSSIQITQEEIAAAVGLTRETVSKHLHSLEKEGEVSLGRGKITLISFQ